MNKLTIAGIVAGSVTLLAGSFFVGRYVGKKNATFVVHEVPAQNKAA